MDESDLRIVLLGKTGAGKSSLCNTIFGEDKFKINHTAKSETTKCQSETKSVNGRRITLKTYQGFCSGVLSRVHYNNPESDLRIVLLGKTGAGKSSLCNTIFKEDLFQISHTANSETTKCQKETKSVKKRRITLIDTPGFFDLDRSEEELKPEIARCITECAPGPHAFLILLKVEKISEQEQDVIDKIHKSFFEEALKYTVVVFTHGDQLAEGMKIEEFFKDNKGLCDLVEKCSGRCHVIDNKYWNNNQQDEYRNNEVQVAELLNTIKVMVDKGGHYTNEMIQVVEREIQQEEEDIRQSSPDMSKEEIREKAKRIDSNLFKKIVGVTTGVLLGALLCVPVTVLSLVKALVEMKSTVKVKAVVTVVVVIVVSAVRVGLAVCARVAEAAGAVVGGCIGYKEADRADSVGEAAVNTVKAVFDKAIKKLNKGREKQSEEK